MSGQTHLVNSMPGFMEKALEGQPFLRVHRSAVVRTDRVRAISRGRFSTPVLELDDATGCRLGASTVTLCVLRITRVS